MDEKFHLPAGLDKQKSLPKGSGRYHHNDLKAERVENAEAVYGILEGKARLQKEGKDYDFQGCLTNLLRIGARGDEAGFAKKYAQYTKKYRDFPQRLAKRLINQKMRFSLDKNGLPGNEHGKTLWTVVSCEDIEKGYVDPVIDIREDGTGREYSLFLFRVLGSLVHPKQGF